jgi:diketogulonate reductase-like aldo/keto reductase
MPSEKIVSMTSQFPFANTAGGNNTSNNHGDAFSGIPCVGFGTYQMRGDTCYDAVTAALEAGYRHVDTAVVYRNGDAVGRAIADFAAKSAKTKAERKESADQNGEDGGGSGGTGGSTSSSKRSDVFLTTKLWPGSLPAAGNDAASRAATADAAYAQGVAELETLGVDYVDLMLIHFPGLPHNKAHPPSSASHASHRAAVYRGMERLYTEGKARYIGGRSEKPFIYVFLVLFHIIVASRGRLPWNGAFVH